MRRQSKAAEATASLYIDIAIEGIYIRRTGGCTTERAQQMYYVSCEDISLPISAVLLCLLCTSGLHSVVGSHATAATRWHSIRACMLLCAMRYVLTMESSKLSGGLLRGIYRAEQRQSQFRDSISVLQVLVFFTCWLIA